MAHNLHHDDCPAQFYGCWNTATKRDASGLLQAITNFEFVVTFVIGYHYLSHMSAPTMKLQRKRNDIQGFHEGFESAQVVTGQARQYGRDVR